MFLISRILLVVFGIFIVPLQTTFKVTLTLTCLPFHHLSLNTIWYKSAIICNAFCPGYPRSLKINLKKTTQIRKKWVLVPETRKAWLLFAQKKVYGHAAKNDLNLSCYGHLKIQPKIHWEKYEAPGLHLWEIISTL